MGRIKEISTLVETKFISLYNIKYLNKKNKEKSWTVASRKKQEEQEEEEKPYERDFSSETDES